MAEPEIATKAPESDAVEAAVEASPFPNDSVAQEGPSMGEHCVTDRPTPAGEVPTGEITKLGDVDVYVTKPADYPHSPSKLLLLLTGGTGIKSGNNQLQADKFASEGYLVLMPDQFGGDPAPNSTTEVVADASDSLLERIKLGIADTAKSFLIDMWLARHTPEKVLPLLHKVIEAAKEEFADAVTNGGGIYTVGYCFGARYALILAGEHDDGEFFGQVAPKADEEEQAVPAKRTPLVKAAAVAHGTQVTPEDISNVKVPVTLICVEDDPLFPNEVRQAGVEALEKAGIKHEVKVYPDVPHGFAVLGDYAEPKIKEAQQSAFGEMLGWLQTH